MGNDITQLCNSQHPFLQQLNTHLPNTQEISVKRSPNNTITHPIVRIPIVENVYQQLIKIKPLAYTLSHQYQPITLNVFQENCIFLGNTNYHHRPHGPAQIFFHNNNYLEALFQNGLIQCSDAIFIESNGNYYRGGFQSSKQTGVGLSCSNGDLVKGNFKMGRVEGMGEKYFQDGRIYTGKFKNGKMEGKGKMIWKDESSYTGYFYNDDINGIGEFKNQFYEYHGPFKQGLKEGKGTIIFKDGNKFQGWFQADFINGYGEWHRQKGNVQKGMYQRIQLPK